MSLASLKSLRGKLSYKKWVLYYRYEQQFGNSGTFLLNTAFLGMFTGMVIDNHTRKQNAAIEEYNVRKENIMAHDKKMWQHERDAHTLNIPELETSVFRFRSGAPAASVTVPAYPAAVVYSEEKP